MNRKLISTLFLTVMMAAVMLSASVAHANAINGDYLTLTLTNPIINVSYGGTYDVSGTITAPVTNLANLFLNATSCTTTGDIFCDDSPFYANTPLFLTPGQSVSGVLFSLIVGPQAPDFPYDNYGGTFLILGGSNGTELSVLNNVDPGSTNFTAAVPEPSSMLLLGSGLSGLVGVIRRKRQK